METTLYADSRHRDVKLYPSGNSYTLFLQSPIHNITQVDLVSAKIPNTMYNLTNGSNVLQIGTTDITLNPGFYSTITLPDTFNQLTSNASLTYLDSEGHFIFTGNIASVTCQTQEIAEMLGLPVGTTLSKPISNNIVYNELFPTAVNYVVSSNVISLEINDYVWLDIEEFRTSTTMDARQLIAVPQSANTFLMTTMSNTSARSFAIVPLDVPSGGIKVFKEAADYPIKVEFPSRIDSLDRLTVHWLNRDGTFLNFQGLDVNSFTLRIHTVTVPVEPERIESLPAPVPYEKYNQKIFWGAVVALVVGLMLIVLTGKRRR